MADRNVYGNDFSENGWRMVDANSCVWTKIPGCNVSLLIREGQPVAIMGAFAADFNAYVEPLRDQDSACWTETNSVGSSNHLSGTAMDLNWNSHPFRQANAGFNATQIATCRELLSFYEDMIFWGNDWDSPKDSMHWQMGYETYGTQYVDKVNSFISRKIRPDGFSTFRKGGTTDKPVPTPPTTSLTRSEGYALRIIGEGRRRNITAKGIQIALSTALVESNIKVYANQRVPDSMKLPHDDVGSDAYSVGIFQQQVRDTGNGWWWGDAAACMGVESSAGLFYDRLVRLPYNTDAKTPGAYAQQVQASAYPDRYDKRWPDAVALYNKLANVTTPQPQQGDDELSAEDSRKIDVIYQELTKKFTSRSPFRHVNEGPLDTFAGFMLNVDGNVHAQLVMRLAQFGDPDAIALLKEVAGNNLPDRQHDAKLAQATLADLAGASSAQQSVSTTPSGSLNIAMTTAAPTTGSTIGAAYDALEALLSSGALDDTEKSPLVALINVLQTKITPGEQK